MTEYCEACNENNHCNGSGTFTIMDQDGLSRLICQCCCGYNRRQREYAEYALTPLIRRYGKEILLTILSNT